MRVPGSRTLAFAVGREVIALSVLLAIGVAGSARAAILDFTGTLELHIATLPSASVPGFGSAQLTDDGSFHLLSFLIENLRQRFNCSLQASLPDVGPVARRDFKNTHAFKNCQGLAYRGPTHAQILSQFALRK